jgi:hypothetical protein
VLLTVLVLGSGSGVWAEPVFVNGLVIDGDSLDATRAPGANAGRLGFFSDLYYDPQRDEWWALLHAYKASAADLAGYVRPGRDRKHGHDGDHGHGDDDHDDDDRDHDDDREHRGSR